MRLVSKRQLKELVLYSSQHIQRLEHAGKFPKCVRLWPCEPVKDVLEEIHSEEIMRGVCTGLFNSRGAHSRGKGGSQERVLADRYRKWADALELSHPFVHSRALMEMVRTYERDAQREDLEEDIRLRLR